VSKYARLVRGSGVFDLGVGRSAQQSQVGTTVTSLVEYSHGRRSPQVPTIFRLQADDGVCAGREDPPGSRDQGEVVDCTDHLHQFFVQCPLWDPRASASVLKYVTFRIMVRPRSPREIPFSSRIWITAQQSNEHTHPYPCLSPLEQNFHDRRSSSSSRGRRFLDEDGISLANPSSPGTGLDRTCLVADPGRWCFVLFAWAPSTSPSPQPAP